MFFFFFAKHIHSKQLQINTQTSYLELFAGDVFAGDVFAGDVCLSFGIVCWGCLCF